MNLSPPDGQKGITDNDRGTIRRSGLRRLIRAAGGKEMTMTACSTSRGKADLAADFTE